MLVGDFGTCFGWGSLFSGLRLPWPKIGRDHQKEEKIKDEKEERNRKYTKKKIWQKREETAEQEAE